MARPSKPRPSDVLNSLQVQWPGHRDRLLAVWHLCLLEMLTLFYPPFRAETEEEMLDQSIVGIRPYVEDLVDLDEGALRSAWRTVRRTHKTERWPTISAILHAANAERSTIAYKAGSYRPATELEREYQTRAYGQVHMNNVTDVDARFHRQQAEDKEAGRLKGPMQLNPFASKRMMH